jgi:peptide/nickel transport system permease protein
MARHLLPNVLGPVLVLATINIATAILTEATLSFLGVGVPPTEPSLGSADPDRQRIFVLGRMVDYHLSGRGAGLMVLSINLLGDWLRDALNPRLR